MTNERSLVALLQLAVSGRQKLTCLVSTTGALFCDMVCLNVCFKAVIFIDSGCMVDVIHMVPTHFQLNNVHQFFYRCLNIDNELKRKFGGKLASENSRVQKSRKGPARRGCKLVQPKSTWPSFGKTGEFRVYTCALVKNCWLR